MKQVFKHFLISTALLFASLGAFAGGDATVIYKLDGNASSADVVGIVTYSSSNGTITVTPNDGNYLEATDLTVYKMIDGQYAQGRTREPNYMTPVAVTATNSGADPSKTTTYTITVPGDEYDYEITANFHRRTSVEDATVTGLADSYTYTGEPIKPVVTVKVGGNTLTLGTDYGVSYTDSINASTDQVKGKITLYGIRTYMGTKTVEYTIAKANPTLTFSSATATYTFGQAFTQPTLTTTPTGLAVTYASSNTNVADVDQSTGAITAKAASTEAITITASFAGNDNYNGASDAYVLTVLQRDIEPIDEDVVYTMDEKDPALQSEYKHIKVVFIGTGNKAFAKLNIILDNDSPTKVNRFSVNVIIAAKKFPVAAHHAP